MSEDPIPDTEAIRQKVEELFKKLEGILAKRRQAATSERQGGTEVGSGRSIEDAAVGFAEDLGRLLGTAERKANDWLSQRSQVTKQLTELRDKATQLLERLGGADRAGIRRRGPGRPPRAASEDAAPTARRAAKGARKRKGMSAAQRKAVGDRMRKYWAARKRAESK
jgi:hypothetical protein